jgi:type IV pilus assembly protein PilN
MIKINLLAEKKPTRKASRPSSSMGMDPASSGRNILLIGVLMIGVVVAVGWWMMLDRSISDWQTKLEDADKELKRLEAAIKKSEEYEKQKNLLSRKIQLITDLKKQQEVPVYILDQVSRNLPDFLWLESMTANKNRISISGKATTYPAVSNFYTNLTDSGFFTDVELGRTFEVQAGVSFSLTCTFSSQKVTEVSAEGQQG